MSDSGIKSLPERHLVLALAVQKYSVSRHRPHQVVRHASDSTTSDSTSSDSTALHSTASDSTRLQSSDGRFQVGLGLTHSVGWRQVECLELEQMSIAHYKINRNINVHCEKLFVP